MSVLVPFYPSSSRGCGQLFLLVKRNRKNSSSVVNLKLICNGHELASEVNGVLGDKEKTFWVVAMRVEGREEVWQWSKEEGDRSDPEPHFMPCGLTQDFPVLW